MSDFYLQRGFSLPEVIIAAGVGLLVAALALGSALDSKRFMQRDIVRSHLAQNLRVGMDMMGIDIRVAGENFPAQVPAIEVLDGVNDTPDSLILRRALLPETMTACTVLPASGSDPLIVGTTGGIVVNGFSFEVVDSCNRGEQSFLNKVQAWQNLITARGGTAPAYIFDINGRVGQPFFATGFQNSFISTELTVDSSGFPGWAGTYNDGATLRPTTVLLAEERVYQVANNRLQIIENGNTTAPQAVVDNITNLQIQVTLDDGTVLSSLNTTGAWTRIEAISLTLEGVDRAGGEPLERELFAQFFPRNVLSH